MSASSQSNDLRNRILFTVFILSIYRLGTFVPLPGIDPQQLQLLMEGNQKGLLGMFNVFAGGAVSRMAIFAISSLRANLFPNPKIGIALPCDFSCRCRTNSEMTRPR